MRPTRARYVTACQQLLALGFVVVAMAPAASVVSLDVVGVEPDGPLSPATPTVQLHVPTTPAMSGLFTRFVPGGAEDRYPLS